MTGAAASATYSAGRKGYGPASVGSMAIPAPNAYRPRFTGPGGELDWRRELDDGFEQVDRQSTGALAAFIAEPILSSGGILELPAGYMAALKQKCVERGMLLIIDEAQTGMGRTGTMFAFERYGIVPDMVVLGKGLGGGVFPMAALVAREGLDVAADRALGHYTHEKSSVGCAAALATIEAIESEGLLERANRLGARAMEGLRAMQARLPAIVEVRGIGLLLAVELKEPDRAEDVMYRCLANGLSFKIGQVNVIVLAPPLVIEERDLDNALRILAEAIGKTDG